jgi:hypothetical protein
MGVRTYNHGYHSIMEIRVQDREAEEGVEYKQAGAMKAGMAAYEIG